jgi:transposase-like protein
MSDKSKVTLDQIIEAIEADDNLGFCLACGAEAYNVEPDARRYTCESCGKPRVYGAEELLLMGVGI